MKRYLSILLSTAMLLSLVSCGSPGAASSTSQSAAQSSSSSSADGSDGIISSVVNLNEDWLPYDENGNLKLDERDAEGENGVISSANFYASKIGRDIIANGGNAIDAAVAVGFAMSTVESYYSGLGGGGYMLIRFAETGETVFLDFRETAPTGATPDTWPKNEDGEWVGYYEMQIGPQGIAVPGYVKGMMYALETYGTMDREQVLSPSVELANKGFPVGAYMSSVLNDHYDWYTYTDETRDVYYKDGGIPYEVGDIYTNPDLGTTIQKIIDEGVDGFYSGSVAESIVATANKYGNTMTMEDLQNYEVKVRTPVSGDYRGYTVISSPPSSSGGTSVIEILNILENFDVASYEVNSPEYINLFSEAFKIAFADRAEYIADTDFTDVPLEGLQSKEFAAERASLIELGTTKDYLAGEPYGFQGSNTTHFSIMDKEGNIVSVTQTNNGGSGITAEGTGVLLNGEMADFSTGYDNANSIEAGKRPLSSMSPTIILDEEGNPYAALGSPGSTRIITTMAEVISHLLDHNMDIQEAIDTPRFFCSGAELYMETRIPESVSDELEAMGYTISRTMDYDTYYGGVHGVVKLDSGILRGGADNRRDGKALGY